MIHKSVRVFTLASALLLIAPHLVEAIEYNFVKLVDSQGPFQRFGSYLSLNNRGEAAFRGYKDPINFNSVEGIYKADANLVTTIAESPTYAGFNDGVSIVDTGDVAFLTVRPNDPRLYMYKGNGGPLNLLYQGYNAGSSTPPGEFDLIWSPAMNNSGQTAFKARDGNFMFGYYRGTGGPPTTIITSNQLSMSAAVDPHIGDGGHVVFWTQLSSGIGDERIVIGDGTSYSFVADTNSSFARLGDRPSVNGDGQVAFSATLRAGGAGIYKSIDETIEPIATTAGPFSYFDQHVSINNHGQLAFYAGLDTGLGGPGIYTGADPEVDKVIAVGDLMFGKRVLSLSISNDALNDRGQVAFFAYLEDNTVGIYRADPIPEPAIACLVLMGTLFCRKSPVNQIGVLRRSKSEKEHATF